MITATTVRGGGRGYHFGGHVSPMFRPAFPSSAIISERSSPSRVRCAAPNNGAPLTAPGRSDNTFWTEGKAHAERPIGQGATSPPKWYPFSPPPTGAQGAAHRPGTPGGPERRGGHRRHFHHPVWCWTRPDHTR